MHEHKLLEFNPLDLLATAATLQRPGREITVDPPDVPPPQTDLSSSSMRKDNGMGVRRTRSNGSLSVENNNSKHKLLRKSDADLKIYKVVVKNELSKMLEEHNYGHPKRNFRYILHDEPFSSADKERELKLMDSNCNEYTDYLEKYPQALSDSEDGSRPDDHDDSACDKNSNTLAVHVSQAEIDCNKDSTLDVCDGSTTDIEVENLNLLQNTNKNTSEMLACSSLFRNEDSCTSEAKQEVDDNRGSFPEGTCDMDKVQADESVVQRDIASDQISECSDKPEESPNTLEGFIVSDSCISGQSEHDMYDSAQSEQESHNTHASAQSDRDMCTCEGTQNGQKSGSGVSEELSTSDKSLSCIENNKHGEPQRNHSTDLGHADGPVPSERVSPILPELCGTGRGKKQTIIRSLLTGETIVVVQKSPSESRDCFLTEDLSKCSPLRDNVESLPLVQSTVTTPPSGENDDITCSLGLKRQFTALSPAVSDSGGQVGHSTESRADDSTVSPAVLDLGESLISRPAVKVHQSNCSTVVISPTQLSVPLSIRNLSREKLSALSSPAVQSALLSKLTSSIKQRNSAEGLTTPTAILADSRLGQLSIGQFASVSSSKIGLVRIQAVHNVHPSTLDGARLPTKARTLSSQQSPAYQQVIKQFPNLVKPNRDEEILKFAVSPDDVLKCMPSAAGLSTAAIEDHVLHDHDYCMKVSPGRGGVTSLLYGDVRLLSGVGREPKLGRPPKNSEKKRKMVRKDTEGVGSRSASPVGNLDTDMANVESETEIKPVQARGKRSNRHKSGRDSSPGETPDSPDIDSQTDGAKVKITGSFQDDFVYFINKTSRNRRRASEKLPVQPLPVPNAADIFIPHLSDADIAALKDRPINGPTNQATVLHPTPDSTTKGGITDEDSTVINTILSMENAMVDPRTDSQGDSFGFSPVGGDALNGLDLTPEQMDILFSAIDGADSDAGQKLDQNKFGLASDHTDLSHVTSPDLAVVTPVAPNVTVNGKGLKPATTVSNSFGDTGVSLLGTEENLHVSNMNLILSDASHNKVNLPTLDPTEVQNSISAITSCSPSSATLGMGHMDTIPSSSLSSTTTQPVLLTTASTNKNSSKSIFVAGVPDLSLPSLEKSLEFIGDRTELFSDVGLPQANNTATNDQTNSPWIVTVSMYWNDLPAVMLDNQPYVRLVDIYKQILPAKDTGILKKRCQLLGMEVKNCSEMHRYFLVKYGRGYNSKSTLVVSKDDAKRLIGFYVEPQSRVAKCEGGTVDKMPSSPATPVPPQKPRLVSETSCDSTASGKNSPAPQDSNGDVLDHERPVIKRERAKSVALRTPARRPVTPIPVTESVSKRLRHKKINFRSMLQGIKVDDDASTAEQAVVSPNSNSDPNLATVTQKIVQTEPSTVQDPRRPSKSKEGDNSTRPSTPDNIVDKTQPAGLPVPPRRRSVTSRRMLKPCRPHPRGLIKLRQNKSYNVLGRQLRRGNGVLHSVLKKRPLNITHQRCTAKSIAQENAGVMKKVAKYSGGSDITDSEVLSSMMTGTNSSRRANGKQRQRLASVSDADNIRSSSRKRKLKQLYPIENYSYAKAVRKSVPEESVRETTSCHRSRPVVMTIRPLRTSPRKKKTDVTSSPVAIATSPSTTSEDEENRPKNVITLTNGPEFDTFTALSGDFSV